ncbi:30S ribosomal protein S21 [Patescibacteria group bacterium]|nr:30S ribosomal protein S21 [Patescibacteria group bacterium]MDE1946328.1 30S ribosomal protein S21 [Patescibacteria group bacterium]MDE2010780.1 30S ribosomal protein S21 [Patescibacteria group bacterium]MDE2232665.1 30S ribosomal protein S21 [Patescibacteria group bacterium]
MSTNIEIIRNPNENSVGALRRFSRKVQSAGIIPRMRGLRYSGRKQSSYKIKQKALKRLVRTAHMAELIKLGKAPVKAVRGHKK